MCDGISFSLLIFFHPSAESVFVIRCGKQLLACVDIYTSEYMRRCENWDWHGKTSRVVKERGRLKVIFVYRRRWTIFESHLCASLSRERIEFHYIKRRFCASRAFRGEQQSKRINLPRNDDANLFSDVCLKERESSLGKAFEYFNIKAKRFPENRIAFEDEEPGGQKGNQFSDFSFVDSICLFLQRVSRHPSRV